MKVISWFLVLFGLLVQGACSSSPGRNSPETCDALVQAALACPYSGVTQSNAESFKNTCLNSSSKGVSCTIDAYKNSCQSSSTLLTAVKGCM